MNKNTYSLLSSNWMFSAETENTLMPFLISIMKGTETEATLNPTSFLLADYNGNINSFEANSSGASTSTEKRVGIINVHHPIFKYDQNCGPRGTQSIMAVLKDWSTDNSIIGVVMDYNSGGGQVSGTREMAQYIFNYEKPIVSYSNDVVGSAAFYLYAAAKHRMLNQYADLVGSIGVMTMGVNMKGVIEKQGGKVFEIYSDLSPEKNNTSRKLQEGDDRPLIEKGLNPAAKVFHADMKMFLPNITEKALKGDVFSPEEAMEEGMIDSFGTLQSAIDMVFELSKNNNNSKSNTNMNTKSFPKVEAVLGLDAPLASNDNGSFLNEDQLGTINSRIEELESTNTTIQEQLDNATAAHEIAITEATTNLTEANSNNTAFATSVDAILDNLGLPVTGTITQKLASIDAKAIEVGSKDGAASTRPIVGQVDNTNTTNIIGGYDVAPAMNN